MEWVRCARKQQSRRCWICNVPFKVGEEYGKDGYSRHIRAVKWIHRTCYEQREKESK